MQKGNDRRADLLEFIEEYRASRGYAPSVEEMADRLGTSKSNIHYHLRLLEGRDVLEHDRRIARSWRLRTS